MSTLVVGSVVVASCGDDDAPSAGSSAAVTTSPGSAATTDVTVVDTVDTTVVDTTIVATTDAPATTAEPTTTSAAPTTTAPAPVGWAPVGAMPGLAYLPCCASNYVGDPSPEIPVDPAVALPPGIYKAFRSQPEDGVFDPATIEFELAPFVECSTPGVFCEEPYAPDEVGVGETARVIAMPLDDTVNVVVAGFGCSADGNYEADHQGASGSALATLQAEYETAYAAEVAPLVAAGTSYDEYLSIFADGRGGFSVPCSSAGILEFRGSAGPAILMQVLGAFDEDFGVVVPPSISVETLYLTALEVGADGSRTLYFYAGFLS